MDTVIFSLTNHPIWTTVADDGPFEKGHVLSRTFPDQETYLRVLTPIKNRPIILVEDLSHPNAKILPLLFFAKIAKSLGATRLDLCAPYLPYMRQDDVFQPGEGITSRYFAELCSYYFDGLITMDPHLHRHPTLSGLYSIPCRVTHAAPAIAAWIQRNCDTPLLIGPDHESKQWVSEIARAIDAPYVTLEKKRRDDRHVETLFPAMTHYRHKIPIFIDDIISTGHTLLEPIAHLKQLDFAPPICIGIHGLFVEQGYEKLLEAGASNVVTCNTVPHPSNDIDVSPILVECIRRPFSQNQ